MSRSKFCSTYDWRGSSRREGGRIVGLITGRLRRSFYNPVFRQPTGLEVITGTDYEYLHVRANLQNALLLETLARHALVLPVPPRKKANHVFLYIPVCMRMVLYE